MTRGAAPDNYRTPGNLATRGGFNARYATVNWFGWVADRCGDLTGDVLDVGCGMGVFWAATADRWASAHLTLLDRSPAMLTAAEARLTQQYDVSTVEADAVALPFEDGSFDAVVAMHMLYHVSDVRQALAEIRRVLRPGGILIITTVADDDLAVMADLSRQTLGSSGTDLIFPIFGTARAVHLLGEAFPGLTHHRCHQVFQVDDTDAAVDYIRSFPPGDIASDTQIAAFRDAFDAARLAAGGTLPMDRLQDMFVGEVA